MPRSFRTVSRASLLLAGVGIAALAANSLTLAAANRALAAQIAAMPGVSVSSARMDGWGGRVVLTGASFVKDAVKVTAARLELTTTPRGFSLISPAMALDTAFSVDNLTINAGPVSYSIAHLEASGTPLTAADFASLLDPANPMPAAERLARFSADSIAIPEMVETVKIAGAEQTSTYRDVKLANVVQGRIGAASIAETVVAAPGAKAGPFAVTIVNTTIRNADLPHISRMLSQARTDAAEPLQTLYESFSADGMTISGMPEGRVSIGRISGQGFRGRALATPYFELMSKLGAMDAKKPTPVEAKAFAAAYADLFRSFEFASIEMRDLAVAVADKGKSFDFKLGRYAITGVAGGRVGEIAMEGLSLDSEEAKFKLGAFVLRGFDFRPLLAAADAFAKNGEAAMRDLAALRGFIPTLDHVGLSGFDIDAVAENGQRGNADNGRRNKAQLGGFSIDAGNFIGGIPTTATASLDHLAVDLSGMLGQPDLKEFAALGYKAVDFSSKLDLGWNQAASEFLVKSFSAHNSGMGGLNVSALFANVSADLFSGNLDEAEAAALAALAKRLEVRFVNEGIVERVIAVEAAKTKKSPDEERRMVIAGASAMIPALLGNTPAGRDIGNAVAKFLANPKSLHLTAVSPAGLGAGDFALLGNPIELIGKVQIKAAANE